MGAGATIAGHQSRETCFCNGEFDMLSSNELHLVRNMGEVAEVLDFMGKMFFSIEPLAEDRLVEEFCALEDVLRELGVVNPERVLDLLPADPENLSDTEIASLLTNLRFECGHSTVQAMWQVRRIRIPLERTIRADLNLTALRAGWNWSYECRDQLAQAVIERIER
jgi:hypothetical protein